MRPVVAQSLLGLVTGSFRCGEFGVCRVVGGYHSTGYDMLDTIIVQWQLAGWNRSWTFSDRRRTDS